MSFSYLLPDGFRSESSREATISTGVTKTSLSSLPMFLDSSGAATCSRTLRYSVTTSSRWRVQLMERGIALIDFVNVDSMVQVHGNSSIFATFLHQFPHTYQQTTRVLAWEAVTPIPRQQPAKLRRSSRTTTLNSWYAFWFLHTVYPPLSLRSPRSSSSTFQHL